jgi:hypothetical protein
VAKSSQLGEVEHHIVAVRLRVVGAGNLLLSLTDYDDVQTENLTPITMQAVVRIEPTRLANFQSQRIRLIGQTTEIDERFDIHRILIFAKPIAVEYPM